MHLYLSRHSVIPAGNYGAYTGFINCIVQECEGHDRENVTAPGGQNDFVAEVCDAAAAAGKPCIVLIMSGSAVSARLTRVRPERSSTTRLS